MANNEIKPFATGANANVTPQGEWENLPALLTGFSSGKASSAQVNKAIRQASFVAATLAQFITDQSGEDVLDDGDQAGLLAKMLSAINKTSQPLDETLVALAALATGSNKLPYFTGNDTASVTDLTATGRNLIGKGSIADVLSYLGLGDAAKRGVGSGVNQIPDMSFFSSGSSGSGSWIKLPSGVIIQFGVISNTITSGGYNVTYPTPFSVTPTYSLSTTSSSPIIATAVNTTSTVLNGVSTWNLQGSRQTNSVNWISIGY